MGAICCSPGGAEVDPRGRAVLVRYGEAPEAGWVGTGTCIGPLHVLTARHILTGEAANLRVEAVEPSGDHALTGTAVPARVVWTHTDLDVALLVTEQPLHLRGRPSWQVEIGIEDWTAAGFAVVQAKKPSRKVEQVGGKTQPCAARARPLNLDLPPQGIVYVGLSGAGVWIDGQLAGVVERQPGGWTGRIQATPVGCFLLDPDFRRAADLPPAEAIKAELLTRLVKVVDAHAQFRERMAERLTLTQRDARTVVLTLLDAPAAEVSVHLNKVGSALKKAGLSADVGAVHQVLGLILPYAADLRTLAAVASTDDRVHALQLFTATLAELVVAALDGREARFVVPPKQAYPEGITAIVASRYAAVRGPVADASGQELKKSVEKHLFEKFSLHPDETSAEELEQHLAYNRTLAEDEPPYYLLFDRQCSEWWAAKGAAFSDSMPTSLRIVRLTLEKPQRSGEVDAALAIKETMTRSMKEP